MSITKKSQGHIEMIFSATIFIGFVIFLLFFIYPHLKAEEMPETAYIQNSIMNYLSVDIGKMSVFLNDYTKDCFSLQDYTDDYGDNFVIVSDPVPSSGSKRRYLVYFGSIFSGSLNKGIIKCDCQLHTSPDCKMDFVTGAYIEEKILSYEKIFNLKDEYSSSYANLKDSFNSGDFSFMVMDFNGNLINDLSYGELKGERKIPGSINIASENMLVRAIDKDGKFHDLIINIKVW